MLYDPLRHCKVAQSTTQVLMRMDEHVCTEAFAAIVSNLLLSNLPTKKSFDLALECQRRKRSAREHISTCQTCASSSSSPHACTSRCLS